jgi:hypothetical protein
MEYSIAIAVLYATFIASARRMSPESSSLFPSTIDNISCELNSSAKSTVQAVDGSEDTTEGKLVGVRVSSFANPQNISNFEFSNAFSNSSSSSSSVGARSPLDFLSQIQ